MKLHTPTPQVKSESTEEHGPCLRWLVGLVVGFTALGVALTHCGQLFVH